MTKTASCMLLASVLAAGAGCERPSERYQGVSEPREVLAERSPATRPTLPAAGDAQISGSAAKVGPASDDTDSPGSTEPVLQQEQPNIDDVGRTGSGKRNGRTATAEFTSLPNVELEGSAKLEEVEGGVRIKVSVEHPKMGVHGVHIHEKADCSDIAGKSMGGHFAPDGKQHGLPGFAAHHLGDLGNLTVQKFGKGELELTVPHATLEEGGSHSFLGRAVVIHAKRDEGRRAQPAGDSGKPIACAPISAS